MSKWISLPIYHAVLRYSVVDASILRDGSIEFAYVYDLHNNHKTYMNLAVSNKIRNIYNLTVSSEHINTVMQECIYAGLDDMVSLLLGTPGVRENLNEDIYELIIQSECHETIGLLISLGVMSIARVFRKMLFAMYPKPSQLSYLIIRNRITPEMLVLPPYIGIIISFINYNIQTHVFPSIAHHLARNHGLDLSKIPSGKLKRLLRYLIKNDSIQNLTHLIQYHNMSPILYKDIDYYISLTSADESSGTKHIGEYLREIKYLEQYRYKLTGDPSPINRTPILLAPKLLPSIYTQPSANSLIHQFTNSLIH